MSIKISRVLLVLAQLVLISPASAAPELDPRPEQSRAAHLSAEVLSRHHYKQVPLDDVLSVSIFDNYLKALDSEKIFFLQSDIDLFYPARASLDDTILHEDLRIPFAIFNRYQRSIEERLNYARALLAKGFNFKEQESYQYNRKNAK
jgi:carboxyl-terminal processing protease